MKEDYKARKRTSKRENERSKASPVSECACERERVKETESASLTQSKVHHSHHGRIVINSPRCHQCGGIRHELSCATGECEILMESLLVSTELTMPLCLSS